MSTHNIMFTWRDKKNGYYLGLKQTPYLELCLYTYEPSHEKTVLIIYRHTANAQTSLRISAVLPKPLQLANM